MSQFDRFFRGKSIVPYLVGVNVAIFALQYLLGGQITSYFVLNSGLVLQRPWTLVTTIFLHGGFTHILFNMYALFIFGPLVEQKLGQSRFLVAYLVSGVIASLGFVGYQELIIGQSASAVGASGAIMAVIGLVIVLLPQLRVLFFFAIPMSMRTAGIIFVLYDIFGLFYQNGVANIAHLVGLGAGLIYGIMLKDRKQKFHKRIKKKSHLDQEDINEYLRSGRI